MKLHERLIKIRDILNIKQKELADGLGISKSVINLIEKGERQPSRQLLINLVDRYNVNISWLLTGKGEIFITGDYKELSISKAILVLKELAYLNDDDVDKVLDFIKSLRKKD